MRVLVIGGTGTVGREIVPRLRERGVETRVLTRFPEKHRADGVEYVGGDLEEPASLATAFEDIRRVYLLTPLHPREAGLGLAAIAAARAAGVQRIVLQTVLESARLRAPDGEPERITRRSITFAPSSGGRIVASPV